MNEVAEYHKGVILGEQWGFESFIHSARDKGYIYDQPIIEGSSGAKIKQNGKDYVNFCGINLLDFQNDKLILSSFCDSVYQYGLVTGGSRATQGINQPHISLETEMSRITGKQSSLIYATGLLANIGFIHSLSSKFEFDRDCVLDNTDVVFILDHDCHWSIWKGVSHLEFGKRLFSFSHNNVSDLNKLLRRLEGKKVVVVFESVYSTDGSIAPLGEILDLCEQFEAISYVDHANGFMIYGSEHQPCYEEFKHLSRATFEMVSFSKAVGLEGGAISGPANAIKSLLISSGTSLFTASIQPPTAATIIRILHNMEHNPSLIIDYHKRVETLRTELIQRGFHLYNTSSYILSVIIGDDAISELVRLELLEQGYLVPIFRYPATKRNSAVIRLIINANHDHKEINGLLFALEQIKKKYGL